MPRLLVDNMLEIECSYRGSLCRPLRKQFPIRLSFAMTINKAQGQTIPNVGIYLPEPVFSHGQLYVALSRGVSRQTTRISAKPNNDIDPTGKSTKNIVYRDVLEGWNGVIISSRRYVLICYITNFFYSKNNEIIFRSCLIFSIEGDHNMCSKE